MDAREQAELQWLFSRCLVHWQRRHTCDWYGRRQFTIVKPRTRPARPRARLTLLASGALEALAEFDLMIRGGELRKDYDDEGYGLGYSEWASGSKHHGAARLLLANEPLPAQAPRPPLVPIRACFTGEYDRGQFRWRLVGTKAGPADEGCEAPTEDQFARAPMPVSRRFSWLLTARPFACFELDCPPVATR